MTGISTFLAAQLNEEETAAQTAHTLFIRFAARPGDWTRLMCDPVIGPFGGQTATRDAATGLYVGRTSDPARVLAEIKTKRAILAGAGSENGSAHEPGPRGPRAVVETCGGCNEQWPCETVRLLAAVYNSHPGYRPEWRPA